MVGKHAFRNACIPVITVLGLQFGQLLGGAIITETVFAWPGVATLTVESIRNQDFPVVQCAVVLLALLIVAVNLIVDVVVGLIDPRIRARLSAMSAPARRRGHPRSTRPAPETSAAGRASWRRLLRLRWGVAAAGILLLIIASAALAPWIAPHDPLAVDIRHRLAPPAWMAGGTADHLLGTDQVGRDLLVARDLRRAGVAGGGGGRRPRCRPPSACCWGWRPATSAATSTGRS